MGLFGPNKDEIWSQFADQLPAEFTPGGFLHSSVLRAQHESWVATLDTYSESSGESSTTYTRIRAPYVNSDGLRFNLYKRGMFSDLGVALAGDKTIETGDEAFDAAFIVRSSDPDRVRRLLEDEPIRRLMLADPDLHLEVKDDEGWFAAKVPDGVDELYVRSMGTITDVARLRRLFDLFAAVLDELVEMGSAADEPPGVVL